MRHFHTGFAVFFIGLLVVSNPLYSDDKTESDNEGRHFPRRPFHFVDGGRCPNGFCISRGLSTPKGHRMVIESFSMSIDLAPTDSVTSISLREQVEEEGTILLYVFSISGPRQFLGGQEFVASQQVRLYPDPNRPVVALSEITGQDAAFNVTISGYFLPLDSPTLSP